MATRLVLHVGVMKSGTTFIQRVLLANQQRLHDEGILFPGKRWRRQVVAVRDLMAQVGDKGNELEPDGPWNTMAAQIREWPGIAILSMEYLGPRSAAQIAAVRETFADTEVEVVLTVRDLARSITSMWTESVQNRGTTYWAGYLRAIRSGKQPVGQAFWRQQRIPAIVERWTAAFGRDHVTVITVPPAGSPRDILWKRFASVAGIPENLCDLDVTGNAALDAPSALVMRRLNERLAEREGGAGMDPKVYDRYVKRGLAKNGINKRAHRGASVGLNNPWVMLRAQKELRDLRALDPQVVGDLAELKSRRVKGVSPSRISTEQQLEAAVDGMAALLDLWIADIESRKSGDDSSPRKDDQ
jgi:hypothetical protein